MGLFRVPFFSIISFSKTWGMGLNGRRSMINESTMRIEYGILSRNDNMSFTAGELELFSLPSQF
jgi:hypothetical protein